MLLTFVKYLLKEKKKKTLSVQSPNVLYIKKFQFYNLFIPTNRYSHYKQETLPFSFLTEKKFEFIFHLTWRNSNLTNDCVTWGIQGNLI